MTKVNFLFYDGVVDAVLMQPTRFREDLLQSRWKEDHVSLLEITNYLKNEIGGALDGSLNCSVTISTEVRVGGTRFKAHPLLPSGATRAYQQL